MCAELWGVCIRAYVCVQAGHELGRQTLRKLPFCPCAALRREPVCPCSFSSLRACWHIFHIRLYYKTKHEICLTTYEEYLIFFFSFGKR